MRPAKAIVVLLVAALCVLSVAATTTAAAASGAVPGTTPLASEAVPGTTPLAMALQDIDDDVPPGNPVIGDERPGDIEPENETRRYVLWGLVALCLIGAGTLLIKIERWEARRHAD